MKRLLAEQWQQVSKVAAPSPDMEDAAKALYFLGAQAASHILAEAVAMQTTNPDAAIQRVHDFREELREYWLAHVKAPGRIL